MINKKCFRRTATLLAAFALLTPPRIFADDESGDEDVIVVTAAKIQQNESDVVEKVQVISEEQIEASGSHTVSELLNSIPGVSYTGTSVGSSEPVQMNGLPDEYVKILIDGIPVTNGGSSDLLEHLQLENVDHVEVLQGSASALYGSDAIAGVINIITKKQKENGKATLRLQQEAASNLQFAGNATAGYKDEKLLAEVNAGYNYQAPKTSYTYVPETTTTSRGKTTTTPAYSYQNFDQRENKSYNVNGTLGWNFADDRSVALKDEFLHSESTTNKSGYYTRNYDRINGTGLFNWAIDDSSGFDGYLSFRQYGSKSWTQAYNATEAIDEDDQTTTFYRDYELEAHYTNDITDWNQFLVGLNLLYSTKTDDSGSDDDDHKQFYPQLFAQDIITLGRLQIIPGARFTASAPIDDNPNGIEIPKWNGTQYVYTGNSSDEEEEEWAFNLSPKLSARFDATDNLIFRASFGMGYKNPTLTQKYNTYFKGYGNPNLKPESSYSGSLGFDFNTPVEGLSFGATGQITYLKDMIDTVMYGVVSSTANGYRQYENLDKVISSGFTAQASYRAGNWNANLSYTYLYMRQWDDDEDEWAEVEEKIPHQVKGSVTYTVPSTKTALNLNAIWYAPVLTSAANDTYSSDYFVLNARIDQPIKDTGLTIYGGAKNLLDNFSFIKGDDDEDMKDTYNLYGAIFYIGAKYNY